MLLKLIFAHLIGMGFVEPMNEKNDDRDLYYLYVVNHDTDKLFVFEHCYEEEILEYIDSGDFEYNEAIRYIEGELVYPEVLTKNK